VMDVRLDTEVVLAVRRMDPQTRRLSPGLIHDTDPGSSVGSSGHRGISPAAGWWAAWFGTAGLPTVPLRRASSRRFGPSSSIGETGRPVVVSPPPSSTSSRSSTIADDATRTSANSLPTSTRGCCESTVARPRRQAPTDYENPVTPGLERRRVVLPRVGVRHQPRDPSSAHHSETPSRTGFQMVGRVGLEPTTR